MKYAKPISLAFLIYFIIFLLFGISSFITTVYDMNKLGGESDDGFGIVISLTISAISLIFLLWSFQIYKSHQRSKSTYLQLGILFLIGILPILVFLFRYLLLL